jgi:hypothetical protein
MEPDRLNPPPLLEQLPLSAVHQGMANPPVGLAA